MQLSNRKDVYGKNKVLGYSAGIIAGITYGLNPLFAKPLLEKGVYVDTMLSIRYLLAVALLGIWLLARKQSLRINRQQLVRLGILGILFALSSMLLFLSYNYIPAGLATTIVFLYPVIVALIMVFLKVYPSWQVWIAIFMTFIGVVILSRPDESTSVNINGLMLAVASALAYALYLIIVNRSRRLRTISSQVITFYALLIGSILFLLHSFTSGADFMRNVSGWDTWTNLIGLAIFPTIIALLTLSIATREAGPTITSVLGVSEPVTAITVGTLVFGESLTLNIIVGVAITIIAVTFMVVSDSQKSGKQRS